MVSESNCKYGIQLVKRGFEPLQLVSFSIEIYLFCLLFSSPSNITRIISESCGSLYTTYERFLCNVCACHDINQLLLIDPSVLTHCIGTTINSTFQYYFLIEANRFPFFL
jgi:hypothetical protein